ncbi:MAG: leucyl aminopeptidase [Candidatus ainarchaeum sp.]|nr:leucyl aminopeptidase [Candidatus ainarchaeum sp.]
MDVFAVKGTLAGFAGDAVSAGVFAEEGKGKPPRLPAAVERIDGLAGGVVGVSVAAGEFSGARNSVAVYRVKGIKARALILVGLGKKSEFAPDVVRQAASAACRAARELKARRVGFCVDSVVGGGVELEAAGRLSTEGALLGLYSFIAYRSDRGEGVEVESLGLVSNVDEKPVGKGASAGEIVASAANFARELANDPGNRSTPARVAGLACACSKKYGFSCKVLGKKEIEAERMGALLAVASGSRNPPAFAVLEYNRAGKRKPVVLVGKGITFDTGGISIKPQKDMDRMKFDKAGACAVLGAFVAAARMRLALNLVGLMPLAENMPGGGALRPGDIVKARSGKTIEVVNTDCEGRMLLSDALDYAKEFSPAAIIDVATLTGSVQTALGFEASGLLGNDEKLLSAVEKAGFESGEKVWRFPMWRDYDDYNKSEVADIRNAGIPGSGSVISGAKFLEAFVPEGVPWAHIDIAGTADKDKPGQYLGIGATGVGVRLLASLLQKLE